MGKTQLALEFALSAAEEYELVAWVRAETPDLLFSDLATLTLALGGSIPVDDEPAVLLALHRETAKRRKWLLVADNVVDAGSVRRLLPHGQKGHLLMTSRRLHLDEAGATQAIDLEKLSLRDSKKFMRRRLGVTRIVPAETNALEELCIALDGLPLALEQAAAYLRDTRGSIVEYMIAFRRHGVRWLEQRPPSLGEYAASLATTWIVSFEHLSVQAPASVRLLKLCSVIAADRIPLGFCRRDDTSDRSLDDVIEPLLRFSLVKRQLASNTFNIHRLVQDVVRESMFPRELSEILQEAACRLERHLPASSERKTWPQWESWRPHVQRCTEMHAEYKLADKFTVTMAHRMASYLHGRHRFKSAESLYLRALDGVEDWQGPHSMEARPILCNLQSLYSHMDRHPEGQAAAERALKILELHWGSESQEVVVERMLVQGWNTDDSGALEKLVKFLPSSHPMLQELRGRLVIVLMNQDRFEEARRHSDAMVRAEEESNAPDHLYELSEALVLRGLIEEELGNNEEARRSFRRSGALRRQLYGAISEEFAGALQILSIASPPAVAERLLFRGLAILETLRDPEDELIAEARFLLGGFLESHGHPERALPFLRDALTAYEAALGPNSLSSQYCAVAYANALDALGRLDEEPDMRSRRASFQKTLDLQVNSVPSRVSAKHDHAQVSVRGVSNPHGT